MARPSGRRSWVHSNPEHRRRTRASRRGGELLYASPELQDFLVDGRRVQVRHIQAHHDLRCLAEPPTGRRARDSEAGGDGHVRGALDEIPKPVVVALLGVGRGRHGHDHRPFAHAAQLIGTSRAVRRRDVVRRSDDNSRRKVQNVRRGSSAHSRRSLPAETTGTRFCRRLDFWTERGPLNPLPDLTIITMYLQWMLRVRVALRVG